MPLLELFGDICLMATKTQSMLQRALEALQRQDLALARCVFVEDDEVDALYDHVYLGLLASMGGRSRAVIKKCGTFHRSPATWNGLLTG